MATTLTVRLGRGAYLSGLLRCGCCGGGMSIIGSDRSGPRIQCSVFKEFKAPAATALDFTLRKSNNWL